MYRVVKNSEPDLKKLQYTGFCTKYNAEATVTVRYRGALWCKTDLQKTYTRSGFVCDLWHNQENAHCIDCPLITEDEH